MIASASALLFTLLPLASAIVTPTTPDGSTVVNEGDNIDIAWAADDTGSWNNVTIQLMTGDNFQMVPLQTLATGVDGTTVTTFTAPAPQVEPNSKIYFLQFTNNGETEATWTTRFTIAGADGSTTEPTETEQASNGETVQWGTGALVGGDNSTDSSAAPSASASASSASTQQSGITNYQPSSTGSPIANPSNGSGPSRSTNGSPSGSASQSDSAASASNSPNSASAIKAGGILGAVGLVMGLAL